MPETELLADQLERTWKGEAWHGPSLSELTDRLTARQAAAHHIVDAHSIWELVLHITAWCREVEQRLAGGEPDSPKEGDWPDIGALADERWQAARTSLGVAVAELARKVRAFDGSRLGELVGQKRDPTLGTGQTYYVMLHGVVQHNLYHGGQIALLRKLA
jgi:uncharacterized damage-inducible protein DinB